jgi:hypothetical protein
MFAFSTVTTEAEIDRVVEKLGEARDWLDSEIEKQRPCSVWFERSGCNADARAVQALGNEPMNVYLETGKKRVFACALDWPGWCRSGKSEGQALDVLAAYAERYAPVAREAGIDYPLVRRNAFSISERLAGSAGYTDFGVPGVVPAHDRAPLTREEVERQTALVLASWVVFDRIVATAPSELRKGPRGGGRDRDRVVEHVLRAEASYARKLGIRHHQPARADAPAIAAVRAAIIAQLGAPDDRSSAASAGWLPRYAARRIAWHVLDHAWEIEDRSP